MYNWKTFNIDFDDPKDLKKLRGIILNRLNELGQARLKDKKKNNNVQEIKRNQLDLIQKIYDTDISGIYEEHILDKECKYYVYVHCDPEFKIKPSKRAKDAFASINFQLKNRPFYVGKGTGKRFLLEDRNKYYQQYKIKLKEPIDCIIIKNNLSEIEALCLEAKLIDIFGFISFGGYLTNLDEGKLSLYRRKTYPIECRIYFPTHIQELLNKD